MSERKPGISYGSTGVSDPELELDADEEQELVFEESSGQPK